LAIAVVALSAAAMAVFLSLQSGKSAPPRERPLKKGRIAEVAPQLSGKGRDGADSAKASSGEAAGEKPEYVKRPGAMQLPDGRVLTFRPPKEGEFRIVHSHGATYKCDHLGNWEDVTPKPVFDNSFEETLLGLATTGNFIPGMLMGIDYDEAIRMLTKPVVVNDDDSEDVVAKKQAVADAKAAILDYMKDGATLDDFVMEMRKQVVKERALRGMALKEIVACLKEGRAQEAADIRDAANKMLENEGAPALKLPEHLDNAIERNK